MGAKRFIDNIFHRTKKTKRRRHKLNADGAYDQDGLFSLHNHDFMKDASFCKAYERGCRAASDYQWHWRVHIGLWAAATASKLTGDFVECGVNTGIMSGAVCKYLDFNETGRSFWLFDTFDGIPIEQISPAEQASGRGEENRSSKPKEVH
jgi:hypothetical protein